MARTNEPRCRDCGNVLGPTEGVLEGGALYHRGRCPQSDRPLLPNVGNIAGEHRGEHG